MVQALHNDEELAIKLSWLDPTLDERAVRQNEFRDGVAIQFSLSSDPPFYMGDTSDHGGVNIWYWKADRQKDINSGHQDVDAAFPDRAVDMYPEQEGPAARATFTSWPRASLAKHDPQFITAWLRPGDYLLGGSPTSTGTGAPDMNLPKVRNDSGLKHERGTVSFVSRSIRKGPVSGGEIGSIFFVLLKDHPEWDKEHVPFGKVVSGLEILEKVAGRMRFESINIVTEAERTDVAAAPAAATNTTTGNPEAKITTSKGELVIELYQRDARNTVANFITLAEAGFYDKDADGSGKQSFFNLMKDR